MDAYLHFTSFHGCCLSTPEPQTQTGIISRHSQFTIHFLWQIPTPQTRSVNEAMIRNLSLILEDVADSAAKEIPT